MNQTHVHHRYVFHSPPLVWVMLVSFSSFSFSLFGCEIVIVPFPSLPAPTCGGAQLPKIDEKQILEGIPEERKRELEEKMKWDRGKQTRRPIHPGRTAPSKPLVRRSSVFEPGTRPKTLDHVVTWFREKEAPRGRCREKDGTISLWFHGTTSPG